MEHEVLVSFCVGELSDGRFVAASNTSPFFCVRAESEKAVVEKAYKALSFYFNSCATKEQPAISRQTTLNTWSKTRVVQMPQLAACA